MHQLHDVVHDPLVQMQCRDLATCGKDRLRRRGGGDGNLLATGHAPHDLLLLGTRRILHVQLHHEPIDLRLGQRICALLLDRVLRGQHEEWFGERVRGAADRDLALLHRLEQGGLHLGRCPIDLVGQHDVREDRSAPGAELA